MIELNQTNYTKILNFFLHTLGYCYKCSICDRRAKTISVKASEFGFDYVSWECPNVKNIGVWSLKRIKSGSCWHEE